MFATYEPPRKEMTLTNEEGAPLAGLTEARGGRARGRRPDQRKHRRPHQVGSPDTRRAPPLFNGVNLAPALLVLVTGQYRNMLFMCVEEPCSSASSRGSREAHGRPPSRSSRRRRSRSCAPPASAPSPRSSWRTTSRGSRTATCPGRRRHSVRLRLDEREPALYGRVDPVSKGPGDELLSGSFVDSGSPSSRA